MTSAEFMIKKLDKVANNVTYKCGLEDVVVFFVSPVTKCLDVRTGYFDEYSEAVLFVNDISEDYTNMFDIPFISFIDGRTYASNRSEEVIDSPCKLTL